MSIYIVGAGGYIGSEIYKKLKTDNSIIGLRSKKSDSITLLLDLENPQNFDYSQISSNDFIIFLSAISSPEFCSKNFYEAFNINVLGTI